MEKSAKQICCGFFCLDFTGDAKRASGGGAQVSWGGSLGMDAERATLGHGWPVGACPPHGTCANVPPRSGGRTPAQRFWLLLAPKVTRPSGRNLTPQHPDAVVATRFKAQCFASSKLQTYKELTEVTRAAMTVYQAHRIIVLREQGGSADGQYSALSSRTRPPSAHLILILGAPLNDAGRNSMLRRGTEWCGKSLLLNFCWAGIPALPKVTLCKSGNIIPAHANNGYAPTSFPITKKKTAQ